MTQPFCGVCGTEARPAFRAPQPEIAPDLDMRPGEPARSTLPDWVQVCRHCGAAAPDLAALSEAAKATVESAAYHGLALTGSEDTLPFRRYAMIVAAAGNRREQAEALLQAAWAADDAAAGAESVALRLEVAALWGETQDVECALRRLDVLRRAGRFEDADNWAKTLAERGLDDITSSIMRFQRARIAARDVGRHLISSALPPPAHRPHVPHAKRTTTGFWSRLLGRRHGG